MSQDERLMILQMVADKKISAAEAAELLRAIDSTDREQSPVQHTQPRLHGNPTIPTPPAAPQGRPPVPSAPPSLSGLGNFIENMVERVTSALSDVVEPRYEFTSELTGDFPAGEVPIRVITGNGRIEVRSWDEPGFQATITAKAGGANEEEARRRANSAYTVKAGENGFDLETRRVDWPENIAVHVSLLVPKDRTYRVEGRSGNGHIEVHGLALTDNKLNSGNGRITLNEVVADRIHVRTGNGSMDITGDIADLDASSGNGTATVVPTGSRSQFLRVGTGNGSVRVNRSRVPADAGLKVDVSTGMGGAHVALPDLIYERETRSMPNKHIVGQTANFADAEAKVVIVARTGMGSVSVE